MLFHCRSARTGWVKGLAGYWRELLFWMLCCRLSGAWLDPTVVDKSPAN